MTPDTQPDGIQYVKAFRRFKAETSGWLVAQTKASGTSMSPQAATALVRVVGVRLCGVAHTALEAEQRAISGGPAELVERLATDAGWADFLSRYPVVARLIQTSVASWKGRVARLVAAVARDHAELGSPEARIEELASHGERLEARRSTLSTTLGNGARWMYREKGLPMASWAMELFRRLNATGLSLPLHVRKVIGRPDYSWDEMVAAGPCQDEGQVRRYFVRAGMLLRLTERLGSADFHVQNVLGAGEYPVLADVETFFHPYAPTSSVAAMIVQRSPIRSGLVGLWVAGSQGRRAAYVAGLNPGGLVPVPYVTKRVGRPGGAAFDEFYGFIDLPATIPAPLGDHLDEIIAGYLEMHEVLAANPDLFGLLARARELPVRVIETPGMVYDNVIMSSLDPELLRSEERRDAWIAQLPFSPLEKGQIRDLVTPRPREVAAAHPALSPEPPVPRELLSRRLDMLVSAVALFDDRPAPARAGVARPPSAEAAAVEIGDFMLAQAYPGPDWVGAIWKPWIGIRQVDPLGSDLLSGNAGLAVVFAYLHHVTGQARFGDTARAALRNVPQYLELDGPSFLGGHCGLGGAIYALARVAALVGDRQLLERAALLVAAFPRGTLATGPFDVVTGIAGLVLGALAVGDPPREAVEALSSACTLGLGPPSQLVPGSLPAMAPDPQSGAAYTVMRLGNRWPGGPVAGGQGHLLWRIGVDAAAIPDVVARLGEPPRDLHEELELALTARDATGETRFLDAARDRASAILDGRARHGAWFPGTRVAERYNTSALTGVMALAHAFLRLGAPEVVRSIWRME